MSSATGTDTIGEPSPAPPQQQQSKLGLALIVIAGAQLLLVMDNTIMNIALPSIQEDLGVTGSNLAWIVNAYALAFGGLMLLGGKAGDLFGRKRVFQIGLVIFTLASLLGGMATNEWLLIAARIVQGVGAAIASPTALSLIATTFPEGKQRNNAMGVYAAMAGLGSTIGLLAGGLLTDYLNWRWVMYINAPVGAIVLFGTRYLADSGRERGKLDVPGAITATGGMVSLVHGITRGGEEGWTDPLTLASFVAAAVLLSLFLFLQTRVAHPMLPLRLLKDRNRAGSYATMLLTGGGMFALFYFLTLYMQQILGYSPFETGLAYLPFVVGVGMSASWLAPMLLPKLPPRVIAGSGALVAAVGLFWLTRLETDSEYVADILPGVFLTGFGIGLAFVSVTLSAVSGTDHNDAGIASGLLDASQQIGGALGLAALSSVATAAADDKLANANDSFFHGLATKDFDLVAKAQAALTEGYTSAFTVGTAVLIGAVLIVVTAVNRGKQQEGESL